MADDDERLAALLKRRDQLDIAIDSYDEVPAECSDGLEELMHRYHSINKLISKIIDKE